MQGQDEAAALTGCPGRGDSSLRCPQEWKEGIEPVCFSSPEETGGGDTTCRCGSHAAATCMWAAGARVRLWLLCCLCVRGAGAHPAPLRPPRQGWEWELCVCVCCIRVPPCSPSVCARLGVCRSPVRGAAVPAPVAPHGCAVGCEQCPCVLLGVSLCRGGVGKGTSVFFWVLFYDTAKVSWHSPVLHIGKPCAAPSPQSKSLLLKPQGRLSTRDMLRERQGEVPGCSKRAWPIFKVFPGNHTRGRWSLPVWDRASRDAWLVFCSQKLDMLPESFRAAVRLLGLVIHQPDDF